MNFVPEIIQAVLLLGFVALYALGAVYAERKVSAFIQDRLGPMEVGPRGLLQTFADIVKLLLKENITPSAADWQLFALAPVVIFVSVFAGFAVIPLGPGFLGAALNVGLLYVLAIVSIDVVGLLMAGWGSNNKYAFLGALRGVSQIISYEIPGAIALLSAVLMFGTFHLGELSAAQGLSSAQPVYFLGWWDVTQIGGVLSWAIFRYPHLILAWMIYFIAALAECNRAPFDLPEAESELVSGFHVEYSGFRFAVIFLAEYANMILVGLVAAIVFWGGWSSPLPNLLALAPGEAAQMGIGQLFTHLQFGHLTTGTSAAGMAVWGAFWIIGKAFFSVFLQMWVRWTFPRVRADQLLKLSWKVLTPIAFLLLAISAVWKLLEVGWHP
ncbi:MAG: NADH-quinone oxidoreductase subunit NuoH [Bacteroidota bacterium]|jgi:NADH-quinone oxidoreductase subunit H